MGAAQMPGGPALEIDMKKVTIDTRNAGQGFSTYGVILDAKTGKVLALTEDKPFSFDAAALDAARALAQKRGYSIVERANK